MATRIFVYGTLKRGCRNHRFLASQSFVAAAKTQPVYRLVSLGGYPGMVSARMGYSVEGEVWDVDADCLRRLDVLEDVEGGLYAFEPVQLLPPFSDGELRTYIYKQAVDGQRDVGPVWREQQQQQQQQQQQHSQDSSGSSSDASDSAKQ